MTNDKEIYVKLLMKTLAHGADFSVSLMPVVQSAGAGKASLQLSIVMGEDNVVSAQKELSLAQEKALYMSQRYGFMVDEIAMGMGAMSHEFQGRDRLKNKSIHLAAQYGAVEVCEFLLRNGSKVEDTNSQMDTALHLAALHGHLDVCKLLIAQGANVSAQNEREWTALHCAILSNNLELCELLLSKGADPSAKMFRNPLSKKMYSGDPDFNALCLAIENGTPAIVDLLIRHGAAVKTQDSSGKTPLHYAARLGDLGLCDRLIKHGVDINAKDEHDRSALYIAAEFGCDQVCKLLAEHSKKCLNESNIGRGFRPLHIAVLHRNMETCRSIIEAGADLSVRTDESLTPLHFAAHFGSLDICELLLKNGADVHAKTNEGKTALKCIGLEQYELSGREECALMLIAYGARASEAKGEFQSFTMAQAAAAGGYLDRLRQLLSEPGGLKSKDTLSKLTKLIVKPHFRETEKHVEARRLIAAHFAAKAVGDNDPHRSSDLTPSL